MRCENLEMSATSQSSAMEEIQRQHKLQVTKLKEENKHYQDVYTQKLNMVQAGFADDMGQLETFYLNEIETLKVDLEKNTKREKAQGEQNVEALRAEMDVEIERLTLLINRYKEKLTRREATNRDLLVELQTYKAWKTSYQKLSQECEQLKQELEKQKLSYEGKIIEFSKEITVHQTTIASLKSQFSAVQN